MSAASPIVSIGLPVYNGERFLKRALDCVLSQDFEDFELIISDNASNDATENICRDYAKRDKRIRYYRNEANIGATPNYNRVLELARGAYFKWAAHDDECEASLLRRCLEVFQREPANTVLVCPKVAIIDEQGEISFMAPDAIGSSSHYPCVRIARVLWTVAYATGFLGLFRREALMRTRRMGVVEADLVLLAEISLLGRIVEIPEVLCYQRRHPGCAMKTHESERSLLAWHDPRRAHDRVLLPHWERVLLEYLKGICSLPLDLLDRVLCLGTVPVVFYWRRFLRWSGPLRGRLHLSRLARKRLMKSTEADSGRAVAVGADP